MTAHDLFIRVIILPIIPILFAYLELGGNWFAYRLLERVTPWSVSGTIVFSVLYSVVAATIAKHYKIDLSLLMVNYGFAFSIISLLLKLEWDRLPAFTNQILNDTPALWSVLVIALIGFIVSAVFVITSPTQP